jgi:hypothetical protein|tara:strand:- start:1994 stop:3022 length:1029 start_codon:yes stop_codon:yes gene_type:complete
MIEINNKYLIGTHIMFYEIEMVSDHIDSIVNAVNRVKNKQNITVDLFFNISEYFEKVDKSNITKKDLIGKFIQQVNVVEATGCVVKYTIYDKFEPLTMVDYRRDLNYFGCVDTDYVIWGESDALLPEQAFEVLENIKNYAVQNNVNKYVVTFALRKMWDDSWKTLEHTEFTDSPFYELDNPKSKTEQCSIRYTMSNDEMNEINSRTDELDIRVLQQPQFDGSILVLSSDLLKNGVNVPRCILGHAVDDTSMMHSCRQIMGESYIQFVVKNILKVHNRNHPDKRNYCLQMDSDEICTQEKGPNQRGNWYETLKQLANINLSNFGPSQNRFNTYKDFNQIMEEK